MTSNTFDARYRETILNLHLLSEEFQQRNKLLCVEQEIFRARPEKTHEERREFALLFGEQTRKVEHVRASFDQAIRDGIADLREHDSEDSLRAPDPPEHGQVLENDDKPGHASFQVLREVIRKHNNVPRLMNYQRRIQLLAVRLILHADVDDYFGKLMKVADYADDSPSLMIGVDEAESLREEIGGAFVSNDQGTSSPIPSNASTGSQSERSSEKNTRGETQPQHDDDDDEDDNFASHQKALSTARIQLIQSIGDFSHIFNEHSRKTGEYDMHAIHEGSASLALAIANSLRTRHHHLHQKQQQQRDEVTTLAKNSESRRSISVTSAGSSAGSSSTATLRPLPRGEKSSSAVAAADAGGDEDDKAETKDDRPRLRHKVGVVHRTSK